MRGLSFSLLGLVLFQTALAELQPRRQHRRPPTYVYRPQQQYQQQQQASSVAPAPVVTDSSNPPVVPVVDDTISPSVVPDSGLSGEKALAGNGYRPVQHYYVPNPSPNPTQNGNCRGDWCGGQPPPPGASVFVPPNQTPAVSPPPQGSEGAPPPPQQSGGGGGGQCSGSGGGFQVSWSGDVVQLGPNMQTTGCTDLSSVSSGRIYVGGNGAQGTLLEWTPNSAQPYYDVSFVEGFTVPLVCRGGSGSGSSGCAKDISGGTYLMNPSYIGGQHATGGYEGNAGASPWCWTCTAQGAPWDQCSGSAYTYPYDDKAMGGVATSIECCVGTSCQGTGREGSGVPGNPQPDRPGGPCTLCGGASKRDFMTGGSGNETEEAGGETPTTVFEEDLKMHKRRTAHKGRRHLNRPGGDNPWSPVNPHAVPGTA